MEAGQCDQAELKFSVSTQTPTSFCATRVHLSITGDYNIVDKTDQNRDGKNCTAKTLRRPRGSWSGSWLSRVGEGSPTLCQTCTTALQALVRVVYLVLMLRLLRGGVRGRWCGFKRNPPSCWAFGCQTAKPLSNERPSRPLSPATDSQN